MTWQPLSSSEFYLHEDEWGMVSLEPEENRFERANVMAESEAFGEAHRAPDGAGWTDMYVAPPPPIDLETRGITLAALRAALGAEWTAYATVTSGYSTYREPIASGYAFKCGDARFYGSTRDDGVLRSLSLTGGGPELADTLHRLGTAFRLILCDLWRGAVVELANRGLVVHYLADE